MIERCPHCHWVIDLARPPLHCPPDNRCGLIKCRICACPIDLKTGRHACRDPQSCKQPRRIR